MVFGVEVGQRGAGGSGVACAHAVLHGVVVGPVVVADGSLRVALNVEYQPLVVEQEVAGQCVVGQLGEAVVVAAGFLRVALSARHAYDVDEQFALQVLLLGTGCFEGFLVVEQSLGVVLPCTVDFA